MDKPVFKADWIKISEYPADFLPKGCDAFIGIDCGEGDVTVKGFYNAETEEWHIQDIEDNRCHNPPHKVK